MPRIPLFFLLALLLILGANPALYSVDSGQTSATPATPPTAATETTTEATAAPTSAPTPADSYTPAATYDRSSDFPKNYSKSLPPLPPAYPYPQNTPIRQEKIEECCDSSYGAEMNIFSRYLWRGMAMSENHPVSQQDVWLTMGNFTGMVWGNVDLKRAKFDQINLYLDYSSDFDTGYWMAFGAIHYIYRRQKERYLYKCVSPYSTTNTSTSTTTTTCTGTTCPTTPNNTTGTCCCNSSSSSSSSSSNSCGSCYMSSSSEECCPTKNIIKHRPRRQQTEFYFSYLMGGMFNPVFTLFRSIGHIRGYSITASGMYCTDHICFGDKIYLVNMIAEADISWRSHQYNKVYYGVNRSSLADINLTLSFPLKIQDTWIIAPMVKANTLVKQRFRKALPHNSAHVAYGITFSAEW